MARHRLYTVKQMNVHQVIVYARDITDDSINQKVIRYLEKSLASVSSLLIRARFFVVKK